MKIPALVDFKNARGANHRGTFLAGGEALGTIAIDIDARESFTVAIENGYLPVAMLAPLVTLEPCAFSTHGIAAGDLTLGFIGAVFFHGSRPRNVGIQIAKKDT